MQPMRPSPFTHAAAVALLGAMLAVLPACAQDGERSGPLRELLKERRAARQAESGSGAPAAQGAINQPGTYTQTLQHDGIERKYMVHVPRSYDGKKPVSLLLSFHGGGGHMEFQADDARYGQISASEREGFVVVFPNGYSRLPGGRLATWNAGGCCGPAKERDIDDVGFARAVVAAVTNQLNIDRQRVFATGFSNGAMLTHRLACEASDVFRGIAPVAGTDNTVRCDPKQPVSVLIIHARNDDHNRFEGGAGAKSVDRGNMAQSTSVPETLNRWLGRNGCPRTPQRVLERPGASCERYAPCRGDTSVAICITERGTHSWPGAEKSRSTESPSQAISANAVMWNFFLGRSLAQP
ncbi:MAG: PHB depolymerase family esterase [Rubrivivax sp.]